jgi:3-dehydroquinate synthase
VAIGMTGEARLSAELGLVPREFVEEQSDLLRAYGLPTDAAGTDPTGVLAAMRLDKKIERGQFRFALLDGVGRAVMRGNVPSELVERTVRDLVRG